MSGTSETARVLTEALDIIRRDGWCTVFQTHKDGRHCLLGALEATRLNYSSARALLLRLTDKGSLALWNDEPGRVLADVTALLTAAVAIEQEESHDSHLSAARVVGEDSSVRVESEDADALSGSAAD